MAASLLPLDLLWNILLCLDVKDLLRFRCVSKFFTSLVDDNPNFIKQHNSLNSNTDDAYGIFFVDNKSVNNSQITRIVDLNSRSAENYNLVFVSMLNRQPRGRENYKDGLLGSSHGLLVMHSCFTGGVYSYSEITIWNPFNGKFKKVPSLQQTQGAGNNVKRAQGFGYDPNTNDYKFLSVVESSYKIVKAFVYSLKSNSWKEIGNGNYWSLVSHLFLAYTPNFGVVANNALHWLRFDPICKKMKIVAFNVVNEEFHCVPLLLKSPFSDPESNIHMSVLDGCLSLTYSGRIEICVWVMKEYSVEQSWTKLFSCRPSDMAPLQHNYWLVSSLTYSRGRDKVLLHSDACGIYGWYDLVSKKVVPFLCALNVTTFAASLVAFQKNINWCGQFEEEEEPFSPLLKKKKRKKTTTSSSASARKKRKRGKGL